MKVSFTKAGNARGGAESQKGNEEFSVNHVQFHMPIAFHLAVSRTQSAVRV